MDKKKHVLKNKTIFFVGLFIYIIQFYFQKSIYSEYDAYRYINYGFRIAIILLLILKIILGRHHKKELLMLSLLSIVALIIYVKSGYFELPLTVLFIFASKDVPFEKILRKLLYYHSIGLLFIFSSCFIGLLEDYTYSHDGVWAHSWGFLYYSNPAFSAMTITILYLIVRKKPKKIEYVAAAILNYLFYTRNTTKLTFFVTVLFILVDFLVGVLSHKKELSIYRLRSVSTITPVVCLGLNLYFVYSSVYQSSFTLPKNFVQSIISRADYSLLALKHYGVRLFGSKIQMIGSYMIHYGGAKEVGTNYYIDSGYLYILLGYGVVFTVLLFVLYALLFYYVCSNNKVRLFVWLVMICLASMGNGLLLDVAFNPILFLTPAALAYSRRKQIRRI